MAERYHLALAAIAILSGLALLGLSLVVPSRFGAHLPGMVGFGGALLGGSGSGRALPWVLVAGLVALRQDQPGSRHPLGPWSGLAAMVSLIGVWGAVPDTEPALAAVCVLTPTALAQLFTGRSNGPAGTASLVVMVLGAVWVGSAGWGSALATSSAVGMVAVAPTVLWFGERRWAGAGLWIALLAHAVVAVPLSRVIMGQPVLPATAMAVLALYLLGGLAALTPLRGRVP